MTPSYRDARRRRGTGVATARAGAPRWRGSARLQWLAAGRALSALGKLFHTTAFKLTLVYLTVFALFAAFLLGYFAWNTRRLITEQITRTVDAEITGLSEQYNQGGIRRLVFIIDARARRPGSSLYLVTTFTRRRPRRQRRPARRGRARAVGWTETVYRRLDDPEGTEHHALVRVFQLPSGFRLLVGRDLEERERLYDIILAAGQWSIALVIVLGLAGGFFVARRVLHRVDAMTETSRTIMAGDLSGRLPIAGSDDELDRLAVNLNVMLERIEALMRGFKEVSDNIAHDLKTPLTRLRNRAEEALRAGKDEADYRAALEAHDRGIRRADPHLQRAADDRARRIRPGQHADGRVRRRRDRARGRRALRSAGRRKGHRRSRSRPAAPCRCAATASWSRRRSPISSTTPSNMPRLRARRPTARPPKSWSRRRARATASRSACPTAARAFRKPTAAAWSSASCGWNRAARSRALAWA